MSAHRRSIVIALLAVGAAAAPAAAQNLRVTGTITGDRTAVFNDRVGVGTGSPLGRLTVVASGGYGAGSLPLLVQSWSTFLAANDGDGHPRLAINNDGLALDFYGNDSTWFPFMTVSNSGARSVSLPSGDLSVAGPIRSNYDGSASLYGNPVELWAWGLNKAVDKNLFIEWGNPSNNVTGAPGTLFITDHWHAQRPVSFVTGNVGFGTMTPVFPVSIQKSANAFYSAYPSLMVNGSNQSGGGIAISDDGGFFDWNDGWITYQQLCCAGGLRVKSALDVTGGVTIQGTSLLGIKGGGLRVGARLEVTGDLAVSGVKNFVQPHPTDPTKEIVFVSLEGPEAGTYCRGEARLAGGRAEVTLPESFRLVTAADGVTAQLTQVGRGRGLYVVEQAQDRLVVGCDDGAACPRSFNWLVHGVRRGYEGHQAIRDRADRSGR